jgi:hypothetical protein
MTFNRSALMDFPNGHLDAGNGEREANLKQGLVPQAARPGFRPSTTTRSEASRPSSHLARFERRTPVPSATFFTWTYGDSHDGASATCVEHPAVGFKGGSLETVEDAIRTYERRFIAAEESARQAPENQRIEETRAQHGIGLADLRNPKLFEVLGLPPEKEPQAVVHVG